MKDLIDDWLAVRKQERGDNRTLSEYRMELRRFELSLGPVALVDANKAHVRKHLQNLFERGNAPATQRRTLAAIRSFYSFLVGDDIIVKNPTDGIAKPKLPERLTRALRVEQVGHVMLSQRVREGLRAEFFNRRDRSLFLLAFSTGLRRAELSSIRLDAVNFTERSINVVGKGNKERVVFFDPETAEVLKHYLEVRPDSAFLFCTGAGRQLCLRQVWVIVKEAFKRAGVAGSTHTLRHSFGTHLYRSGADIHTVQRLLGHESISVTQRYVHLDRDDLKAAYDRVTDHPAG